MFYSMILLLLTLLFIVMAIAIAIAFITDMTRHTVLKMTLFSNTFISFIFYVSIRIV